MFIATFLKEILSEEKLKNLNISCFTATAKKDVIEDIKKYFKENLDKEFLDFI
jgi:ATP-dependent DNA helicase RecQ